MPNYDQAIMDAMRQSSDTVADELIRWIMEEGQHEQMALLMTLENNSDQLPEKLHPRLKAYLKQCSTLPDWADQEKITQAERFFEEYQVYVYMALLFASLPYCYGAADGARVLASSNRIQENTGKRLSETGQFIQDVSQKGAFSSIGKAYRSIAKVRLIHAAVRYRLLESGKWQTEEWGLPTNMEDMAGTNLAFSVVTLRAMERMGVSMDLKTRDAVIHKWNVISYLLGVDEQVLAPDYETSLKLEKQIIRRLFRKSEQGVALTQALLLYMKDIEKPLLAPDYGSQMMRYLLGDQMGDIIGLEENSIFNWPSLMGAVNGVLHQMGWSPKQENMLLPIHLALIKRGKIQNQRLEYPLEDLLNKTNFRD